MKKQLLNQLTWVILPLLFSTLGVMKAQAQDVILQGYYWNSNPGDITSNDGIWWDTIALVAPYIADAGFQTVWTPPANKGFANVFDMGFGIYDYYDFGEFNQKGSLRTRHGNKAQLLAMIQALHNEGLLVMADLVLNHRGGGDGEEPEACDDGVPPTDRFTLFTPASNRFPMDAADFHPNNGPHCDVFPPFHDRIFFEDICYFNFIDQTLDSNLPNNGWFFGPHNLGKAGDSLIVWGRYLLDEIGFDELRLDAVKHIEPGFLAPFLVELANGNQPYAVGELFDGDLATLKGYHDDVEGFVSNFGVGSKDANLAIFDFNLRFALRDMCNNTGGGFDMWSLNGTGLKFNPAGGLDGEDIVTFVENHDVDRIGWQVVNCSDPHNLQIGNSCLQLFTDGGHDPVLTDKDDMGYPYIMAAEGRPSVFWKDIFWYGLEESIFWQMALREATASGGSIPIQSLNPSFSQGNGGDLFVFNRYGTTNGASDGMILALNDNASSEAAVWINSPFNEKYLKDYSDGYLFQTSQAFADGRANVKAQPRDYAWWSVTGLYPKPPSVPDPHFSMDATPGGCPHFIALRVDDAANLLVNGNPIEVGDEVAVKNGNGDIVGIGRIGQSTQWDGVHDMIIEVLGAPSSNGMGNGEAFTIVVYDQSAGTEVTIDFVEYAPAGNAFSFSPDRPGTPNRNGNFATFNVTTTRQGLFDCSGISQILSFNPPSVMLEDICGGVSQADAGVYNDNIQNGDNDGSNFQPWTNVNPASNNNNAGNFVASSTNNSGDSNSDGDINTNGEAWGFYANSSNISEATRPFASPLTTGQTFFMRMDNGGINNGGTVGFGLRNSSNQNVFEFFFVGGESSYTINDASGANLTGIGFTNEGLALEFILTSPTTYQFNVTTLVNSNTFNFSGSLMSPGGNSTIDRVRLFNFNAGGGSGNDLFFNSLQVCDAPSVVINEVDYDQPGGDAAEFIELRNNNTEAIDLDLFSVEFVDGNGGAVYLTIDLPAVSLAPGDYYVICQDGLTVPNCDLLLSGNIQDETDAIRLLWNGITIDALSYEGDVAGAVEGSGSGLEDVEAVIGVGLSRNPDGSDTDQNNVDFQLACITPGGANSPNNADSDNDDAPDTCDDCPLVQDEGTITNFDITNCACDPGFFPLTTTINGQEIITGCDECPPGFFCPDGLQAIPCNAGTFQDQPGQTACMPCGAGTFQTQEGQTSCDPCPAGTFQGLEGQVSCEPCPIGQFNPSMGAVECLNCPSGSFNTSEGNTSCDPCPAISAVLGGDALVCPGDLFNLSINISGGAAPYEVTLSDGNTYTVDNAGTQVIEVTTTTALIYNITGLSDALNCPGTNLSGSVAITLDDCGAAAIPTMSEWAFFLFIIIMLNVFVVALFNVKKVWA